jgi:hypothetical protein
MSFFKLDESQAGGAFEPMPIGEYEAIITGAEVTNSANGNPMIKITLTVRDDVDQEGKKRKVFDNAVATEKAMFKFHQLGKALGIEAMATIEGFAQAMLYKPIRFKNKHEEYNGKVNDKVNYYSPAQVDYNGQGGQVTGDPFAGSTSVDISDDDLPF